jgi:hypothetical protein
LGRIRFPLVAAGFAFAASFLGGTSAAEARESVSASSASTCDGVPLRVKYDAWGAPERVYVIGELDGEKVALWFDTGADESHLDHGLSGPEVGPSKQVTFGGKTRTLRSWRRQKWEGIDGLRCVGAIGTDEVLGGATEIDFKRGCLTKRPTGQLPVDSGNWWSAAIDVVNNRIVTNATINGSAWRLMFDTGVYDTIVISPDRTDFGPDRFSVGDVLGTQVMFSRERALFSWQGSAPRQIPTWATARFSTFDMLALGPGIRGMLGLTTIGKRRVVIDSEMKRMLVEPCTTSEATTACGATTTAFTTSR